MATATHSRVQEKLGVFARAGAEATGQDKWFEADAGWNNQAGHAATAADKSRLDRERLLRSQSASRAVTQMMVDQAIEKIDIEIGKIDDEIADTKLQLENIERDVEKLTRAKTEVAAIDRETGELRTEQRILKRVVAARTEAAEARDGVTQARQDARNAVGEEVRFRMRALQIALRRVDVSEQTLKEIETERRGKNISGVDVKRRLGFIDSRLEDLDRRRSKILKDCGLPKDATPEEIQQKIEQLKTQKPELHRRLKELQGRRDELQAKRNHYAGEDYQKRVAQGNVTRGEFWDELPPHMRDVAIKTEVGRIALNEVAQGEDKVKGASAQTALEDFDQNWQEIMRKRGMPVNMSPIPDTNINMSRIPGKEPQMSYIPGKGPQASVIPVSNTSTSSLQDGKGIQSTLAGASSIYNVNARGTNVSHAAPAISTAKPDAGQSQTIAGQRVAEANGLSTPQM